MKKTIGILRLVGIISFAVFVFLFIKRYEKSSTISGLITLACFAAVMALQLYRLYMKSDLQNNDNDGIIDVDEDN